MANSYKLDNIRYLIGKFSNSSNILYKMNYGISHSKLLLILSITLFLKKSIVLAQETPLPEIRNMFNEAIKSESSREKFCRLMAKQPTKEPIMLAYKGTAKALEAKVGWNPLSRIANLKEADRLFERAIAQEPRNIEMRFLRFSMQFYIPKWLGLSDNLYEDKQTIIQNIQDYKSLNIDDGVLDWIQEFMIDSGYCSQSEIATIKAAKTD